MKKIFKILGCFVICLTLGLFCTSVIYSSRNCYATEVITVEEVAEVGTQTEVIATEETEENSTFFGRIWEWLQENYPELITTVTGILVVVLTSVVPKLIKKGINKINDTTSSNTETQSEVVKAVNSLIESYNKLEAEQSEAATTESERYKVVYSMCAQTKAVLEILITVYANSKNVPQAIKDIINAKYAEVLKTNQSLEESAGTTEVVTEESTEIVNNETGE